MNKLPSSMHAAGKSLSKKANPEGNKQSLNLWLKLLTLGNDSEEGQGLVEYALILLLVAIVVIAILVLLGPSIGGMFSAIKTGVS